MLRALALVSSLSPANPLAKRGSPVRHQKVLDVDRTLGKIDAINDPMGPRLDRREPSLFAPVVKAQALGSQQHVRPSHPGTTIPRRRTATTPIREA